MVSVTGSTCSSVVRDCQGAPELRGGCSPSPEPWSAGVPCSGVLACGRKRDLSGSLVIPPMPLPCSKTPAEPAESRPNDSAVAAPGPNRPKALSDNMISGLAQGFSIRCLRFTNDVAVAHARLASGWRAAPLPGGGRTLWMTPKGFRFYIPFSFPGLALTQAGSMQSDCCTS